MNDFHLILEAGHGNETSSASRRSRGGFADFTRFFRAKYPENGAKNSPFPWI
jgi:hypothetical protein